MVRLFKPKDSEGVKTLILSILTEEYPFDKSAYADSDINNITDTYSGSRNSFFVYETRNNIVGSVGVKGDSEKTALLRRLFVAPRSRHKGIGTRLLKKAVGYCKEMGYAEIVFRSTDRMKDAMKLIKKHGFVENEKLEISGFHIHIFKLTLQ